MAYSAAMDCPQFILDGSGTRILIGLMAGLHVLINHPLAVGIYPLLCLMEYIAIRKNWKKLDELAYRITFIVFVITTTVGAMTGVGIWLTTSLAAPFAIGSLLRVFFWGWFAEWIVFICEVVLALVYFMTWKRWSEGAEKRRHLKVGIALSIMSWFTMALIVAVLSFMMDSGGWTDNKNFFTALFNPLYVPQLAFRTTYALMAAGFFALFCAYFFTKRNTELRTWMIRFCCIWSLGFGMACYISGYLYEVILPGAIKDSIAVGALTMKFASWQHQFAILLAVTGCAFMLLGFLGAFEPQWFPRWAMIVPLFLSVWLLGHFERVREFIRKPYIISNYMYSNGVRKEEVAMLQYEGMLKQATYVKYPMVTPENRVAAGREVFSLSCVCCHTTDGLNGVLGKFTNIYGKGAWDNKAMKAFVSTMHVSRPYMPPFSGNDEEAEALVAYILDLRNHKEKLKGAQEIGVSISPAHLEVTQKQKSGSLDTAAR